ncbi:MAG: GNAT family N-acetyltransferase, partial [Prosthecobacter sp.]|nr:GNAT family N-acetyltransferase [Prosthecobacter sp.]
IVTNAGGPAALATDMLVTSGGKVAAFTPETLAALDQLLPAAWSHGNPVDILGPASADMYAGTIDIVLRDPSTDGLLVVLTPQAMTEIDRTADLLCRLAQSSAKPVLASWMGGASLDAARATLNAAGVPTYDYPDAAARAFTLMWQHSDRLRMLYERPALPHTDGGIGCGSQAAAEIVSAVRSAGRVLLTEVESKQVLAAYGIPTVETLTAHNEEQAVGHAEALGYPVVLKVLSETITHKSDVGGVCLDVHDAAAVRRAWHAIQASVSEKAGASQFLGVTVQPMAPRGGIELILGSSIDPQFGPVLLFGAGGEWVEVMKDRALGFPPLTATLAHRLMEETRIYHALTGVRGHESVDLDSLAQLLVSFSHLVAEQRWIAEIDINPLVVRAGQFLALDARIVLHPRDLDQHHLPRLAIRPYPAEYVSHIRLDSGAQILLRPIRPEDEMMLIAFHSALSEQTVRFRYCGQISLQARTDHDRLVRICFSDYDRELVLVAEHGNGTTRELVGVGRLNRLHGSNEAEFAVVVSDEWQGQGLGTRLMASLIDIGRAENLQQISGIILADNAVMLRICRRLGFRIDRESEAGDFIAKLIL